MNFTEQELLTILASFIWPFIRISSMFITIPVFSVKALPAKIRVILSLLITLVIIPVLPDPPSIQMFSYQGFLVTVQQLVIGLSTGFILQMVFAIMLVGGQSMAYSMGLGFASMVDPATGVQVPVIAQIFVIASSLMFLAFNGHLLLIEMLVASFTTLPIATTGFSISDIWSIVAWSSQMFAGGLLLAIPVMMALLFVNISFGVAARAAPQLQIFGVGFPITIMLGMVLIWIYMAAALDVFSAVLTDGFEFISQLLKVSY